MAIILLVYPEITQLFTDCPLLKLWKILRRLRNTSLKLGCDCKSQLLSSFANGGRKEAVDCEDEALLSVTNCSDDGTILQSEQGSVKTMGLGTTAVLLVVTNPC